MGSRTNGDPVTAAKRDFMRSALAALTSALLLSALALVPQAAAAQGGGPARGAGGFCLSLAFGLGVIGHRLVSRANPLAELLTMTAGAPQSSAT